MKEVVANFFIDFSLFEFAMKKMGVSSGLLIGNEQGANADWENLAKRGEIISVFKDRKRDGDFDKAIAFYLSRPPEKQVVIGDNLKFQPRPEGGSEPHQVLFYLRRVRNNLFHGGKFVDEMIGDPTRDFEFIKHGNCLLYTCLDAIPDMNKTFQNAKEYFNAILQ